MVAFSFIMLAARFVTCDFGQPHICGQGVSGKSEGSETPIGPTICESGSFCNYDFGVFGECELCPQKLVAEDGSYACFFRGLSMHGRDSCLNLCLNPNFSELVESAAVQAEVPAAARQLSDGSSSVGSSTGSTSSSSESSGGEAMVVGAKVVFELNVEGATLADVERDLAMYKRAIADSLTIDPSRVDITVRTATAAPRRTRRLAGVVLEVTINAETLGSANAIKASIQSPQYIDAKLAVALNQEGVNSAGVNLDASSVQVVEVVPSTSPTSAPTALLPAGDHVDNGNSKDDVRSEFNSLDAKAKMVIYASTGVVLAGFLAWCCLRRCQKVERKDENAGDHPPHVMEFVQAKPIALGKLMGQIDAGPQLHDHVPGPYPPSPGGTLESGFNGGWRSQARSGD